MIDINKTMISTAELISHLPWSRLIFIAVCVFVAIGLWKLPEILAALK